jgi:hypothetical protein
MVDDKLGSSLPLGGRHIACSSRAYHNDTTFFNDVIYYYIHFMINIVYFRIFLFDVGIKKSILHII